ncbi:M64 family metallopeptidase, partial [Salmonella enterica]|uniref:M64 family metallopeptidase n=1 Tax=Salmonella enterica TaxID=28901 RepID=UPI003F4C0F82
RQHSKNRNAEKLGVYEGGGYVSKGVYRPWINCLMNNLHTIDVFCPVCNKSIQETIDLQCE